MSAAAYSPGWAARVELGPGQERIRARLASSIRHPSRTWHDAPTMRDYGRSSSTAHRTIHRLAALGVVAIQATLGRAGGVRFTFGVRYWRRSPIRRGQLARFAAVPGQLGAWAPPDEPEPEPGELVDGAEPESDARARPGGPALGDAGSELGVVDDRRRPTFGDLMRRYGFDPAALVETAEDREARRRRRLGR